MAATVALAEVRDRDRAAMRRLVADHGFAHAIDSIVTAVVSEIVKDTAPAAEDRMDRVARVLEARMLDSLVMVARALGWAPAT